MKKLLLTLAALGFMAAPAYANHAPEHNGPYKTITIQVNGLVCDFCARALEKVFYQQTGVEGVDVNLDTHMVTLDLDESADIPDDKITSLILDAGYNVVNINRTETEAAQ